MPTCPRSTRRRRVRDVLPGTVGRPRSRGVRHRVPRSGRVRCPAVAGRSGGSHEAVVDGETGFVVEPHDVDARARRDPRARRQTTIIRDAAWARAAPAARPSTQFAYDRLAARPRAGRGRRPRRASARLAVTVSSRPCRAHGIVQASWASVVVLAIVGGLDMLVDAFDAWPWASASCCSSARSRLALRARPGRGPIDPRRRHRGHEPVLPPGLGAGCRCGTSCCGRSRPVSSSRSPPRGRTRSRCSSRCCRSASSASGALATARSRSAARAARRYLHSRRWPTPRVSASGSKLPRIVASTSRSTSSRIRSGRATCARPRCSRPTARDAARKVEFRAAALGKSIRYVLAYDFAELPDAFSWKFVEGDMLRRLDGTYRFEAEGAGQHASALRPHRRARGAAARNHQAPRRRPDHGQRAQGAEEAGRSRRLTHGRGDSLAALMRILLFTGKGGVGKTTVAAAHGRSHRRLGSANGRALDRSRGLARRRVRPAARRPTDAHRSEPVGSAAERTCPLRGGLGRRARVHGRRARLGRGRRGGGRGARRRSRTRRGVRARRHQGVRDLG